MSTFVEKVDNNGNTIRVGMAKLVSPINMDKPQTYTNKDGVEKSYFLSTIEVESPSGKKTTLPASVYPKTIAHFENMGGAKVGSSYLVTLQRVERNDGNGMITFARLSHLVNAIADESVMDDIFGEAVNANVEEVEAVA